MAEFEDDNVHFSEPTTTQTSLAAQLATLLSNLLQSNSSTQKQAVSIPTISLSVKLNKNNYSMWSRLILMKIGGQGKLHHLIGIPEPTEIENPNYTQ